MEAKIKITARIESDLHKAAKDKMRAQWGDEYWQGLIERAVKSYVAGDSDPAGSIRFEEFEAKANEPYVLALNALIRDGDPDVKDVVMRLLKKYIPEQKASKAKPQRSIRAK